MQQYMMSNYANNQPLGSSGVNNLTQYIPQAGNMTAIGAGTALGLALMTTLFLDETGLGAIGLPSILTPVAIGYALGVSGGVLR